MFSKRIENTVGKREIACYEQFLIFPQCFQKTCTADTKKQGLFGKGLSQVSHKLSKSILDFLFLSLHAEIFSRFKKKRLMIG